MDQVLTYILSAVGILGFFLAGKKVWWAWYVNIANQLIWLFFSVITQQWGFLIATGFYFVVFTRNAYLWTKEHNEKKSIDKPIKAKHFGMRWGYLKSPMGMDLATNPKPPQEGPVGPAGAHSEEDREAIEKYMKFSGTNPEVSNQIAFVVLDVMRARNGRDHYVGFTERYGIAHEVQRRLDVSLKGTRLDVRKHILKAIHQIDIATQRSLGGESAQSRDLARMSHALGYARNTFEDLLKGEPHVDQEGNSTPPRNTDRDGVDNDI